MKKPIIGAKKKASKARMAEVKKIPSRSLSPSSSEMEMRKKKAASEVASVKPQGVKSKPASYRDEVQGNETWMKERMEYYGPKIRTAAKLNAIKKGPTPIERDMKKKQLMSDYKKNSAAGAKKATKKK